MPLLDVSDVLLDPDFMDTSLVCHRQVQTVDEDNFTKNTAQDIPFSGVVTVDRSLEARRMEAGQNISGAILIVTQFRLTQGQPGSGSSPRLDADIVTYSGRDYRVTFVDPYTRYGGAPAETDAELRIRQGQSVALPSLTPFEGVDGAIANVAGVTRHKLYENDTGATDSNGLPPHSISAIVDGGDVTEIAQTIRGNKGQGTATYGTTSVTVPDTYGNPHVISFSRSTDVPIYGHITLKAFTGYTSQIGVQIQQAVADYINGLTIGDSVLLSRIYSPANLGVVSGGSARYYDIQELLIGKSAGTVAAANINIAYNESASCKPENIVLTVTS